MRQSGRVHWITVVGLLGIVALVVLLFAGKESPANVASRFMSALARHDVEELTSLSFYEGDPEQLRKGWDYAVNVAGKHFLFRWSLETVKESGPDTAAVKLKVERALGPNSFPENFDLPLVLTKDGWRVDVRGISRNMFPGLPR
ncbi:MAG: DUF2950 domain-containing protein [Fimbriimonadaceae bacterium]|uniref:DUF4878 domain-containing protein n=1 Tax=Candidatus Nitrosymbiomonas proteolyticus TaxID=2608984 RepID=A0A809RU67_9BACT|nr:DUF2950 domain-containing protein [Fimbriimonadaceae bacterium]NUM39428.1 hypothetical protein [Armatimonadota bacterium]QOJ11057.1 MAG: hypothetical protein HRU74_02980 [Chthonomonadaceae bacterium]BBO23322.1 conserved hypothetical protein [Candidatus Nitrosymbiomonas proteolyticus]MCL4284239.1 hypothetical protein [Fimbriimonadaceae bacterium]